MAMTTTTPLIPAVFIRRYQRFLADVELDGRTVTVHVPNTGSMLTLQESGVTAWLRPALPGRKLPFTLVLLGLPAGGLALVDTSVPNALVTEAVAAGAVPELAGYATHRREVAYGSRGSRIDLLLQHPDRPVCHVEVKNVTMRSTMVAGRADFPDARSERGAKHLAELADVARSGGRAVQFYLLSRDDCDRVGFAGGIDPLYAQAAREARDAGVEFLAYRARLAVDGLGLGERCRVEW
jgi:sugar fermentation stimulation protein A